MVSREIKETPWKVNLLNPGFCVTLETLGEFSWFTAIEK